MPRSAKLESRFEPDLLGGVTVIRGEVLFEDDSDWAARLYRSWPPSLQFHIITAIPYYVWDNRQSGEMRVWLQEGES